MLEYIILFSIAVWFMFYMINYAEITEFIRKPVFGMFSEFLLKLVQCPLCYTFWLTLMAVAFGIILFIFTGNLVILSFFVMCLLTSPVIVLFIDILYHFINKNAAK